MIVGSRLAALLSLAAGLFGLSGPVAASDSDVEREYLFGIQPLFSPAGTVERWQPLLDALARRSGLPLRAVVPSSLSQFERQAAQGEFDYLYTDPALYLELEQRAAWRGLVQVARPLRALLVARDSHAAALEALANAVLAFPGPRDFGSCRLTRTALYRRGIPHAAVYLGSQESVLRALREGHAVAGGVTEDFWLALPPSERAGLAVRYTSPAYPGRLVAAHPRVPPAQAERLREALLAEALDPAGAKRLAAAGIDRFMAYRPAALASLRARPLAVRPTRLAFHVIPRLPEDITRRHMEPLAAYLRQVLDMEIALHTYPNMASFERSIYAERRPALVNANPLQAVQLVRSGFHILAQQLPLASPEGMRGLILVKADSPYQRLEDLAGRRIAFGGGPHAFFASIVPRVLLKRAGLAGRYQDVSPASGTVTDVIALLIEGKADAVGSGSMAFASREVRERYGAEALRILAQSEPLPGLAWLAGPQLERSLLDDLRAVLRQVGEASPADAAFRAAGVERLLPADAETYRRVQSYLEEN
jgi:phosphonate transport system substrate-binding protein